MNVNDDLWLYGLYISASDLKRQYNNNHKCCIKQSERIKAIDSIALYWCKCSISMSHRETLTPHYTKRWRGSKYIMIMAIKQLPAWGVIKGECALEGCRHTDTTWIKELWRQSRECESVSKSESGWCVWLRVCWRKFVGVRRRKVKSTEMEYEISGIT